MPQSSLIVFDNRVLKEDYRNYDLIARYWNEEYRGRIWKNKERIADYGGTDLDEIMARLKVVVDQIQAEKRKNRGKRKPSATEIAEGLRGIEPKLSPSQKMMLSLQQRAPGHIISVKSLNRLGDYGCPQKAFDAYLQIATRLSDELAYTPSVRRKGSKAKLALMCEEISASDVVPELALTLKPELVSALELLG